MVHVTYCGRVVRRYLCGYRDLAAYEHAPIRIFAAGVFAGNGVVMVTVMLRQRPVKLLGPVPKCIGTNFQPRFKAKVTDSPELPQQKYYVVPAATLPKVGGEPLNLAITHVTCPSLFVQQLVIPIGFMP